MPNEQNITGEDIGHHAPIDLTALTMLSSIGPQFSTFSILSESLANGLEEDRKLIESMFSKEEIDEIIADANEIALIAGRLGEDISERIQDSIQSAIDQSEENKAIEEEEGLIDLLTEEQEDKLLEGNLLVKDLDEEQRERLASFYDTTVEDLDLDEEITLVSDEEVPALDLSDKELHELKEEIEKALTEDD